MKTRYSFLISILLFMLLNLSYTYSETQTKIKNNFKHLTTKDGLSQNSVTDILKDQYGFIWFGTYNGLNRYNGYGFKQFPMEKGNPKALSSKSIRAITEDKEGYIWIGTLGGGVCRYNPITERFNQYLNDPEDSTSIGGNIVKEIYEDKEGILWFGRPNGISKYNPQQDNFTQYNLYAKGYKIPEINQITGIYEGQNHILWIGSKGGLFFEDRKDSVFNPQPFDASKYQIQNINLAQTFYEDSESNLWIGTHGSGIFKFDSSRSQVLQYTTSAPPGRRISSNLVVSIEQDKHGRIWIGTRGGGLNIYYPERNKISTIKSNQSKSSSLSVNSISEIYNSNNNMVWIGTIDGGVNTYYTSKEQFKSLTHKKNNSNSLINNHINNLKRYKNTILIGTDKGLDRYNPATGNYKHYQIPEDESNINEIINIATDDNDIVWLGTNGAGLIKYNLKNKNYKIYNEQNGLSHNYVYSIAIGEKNTIWIATQNGGLNRFNPKTETFTYFIEKSYSKKTMGTDRLNVLYKDTTNKLWIGTPINGLYYYDIEKKQFTNVSKKISDTSSIPSNFITTIIKSSQGNIWAGTNNGLLNYDPQTKKLDRFLVDANLPSHVIQGIIEDSKGFLWLSTDRGLIKFNPSTRNYHHFTESDGLVSNQFYINSYVKFSNHFYFGTSTEGIVHFRPENIHKDTSAPKIKITDLKISNKSVPIGEYRAGRTILNKSISHTDKIQLSHRDDIISFNFVALHYAAPEKNQYAYKLENFETSWNYSGNRRFATYTNLSPGEYTFHVKGANNDNVWNNKGTKLDIVIPPPFWQTNWFYILITLVSIGGVVLIIHYRTKSIKERQDFLEEMNRKLNTQIEQKDKAIQEKMEAKEELEKVKNYIDNIINSMPSILISVNANGKIIRWNQRAFEETGISPDEAIGQYLKDVFPRLSKEEKKVERAIENHEIRKSTDNKVETENETRYEDITIYPLDNDETEGAVIRIDDKTEQKQLEEMMIQSEKMLSVGGLAAGMAHEINNPLAGMMQNASVVINRLTNTELSANQEVAQRLDIDMEKIQRFMQERNIIEQLELINESGRRASKIVKNMLSFARKNESKFTPVQITDLLEDTVDLAQNDYDLKKKYDFRKINIEREYENNLPKIQCERSKIQQVFLNLLKNGAEAMHKKMDSGELKNPKFILRTKSKDGKVKIEIEDNGPGIPDKVRKRVFEPFFTTKEVNKGTGLGLSVSYFIVTENHNGEMRVESTPGEYTKFIIILPIQLQENQ